MTIDHIMIKVKDWPKAKAYYEQALTPLGYELLTDGGTWGGFARAKAYVGRIYIKQGQQYKACNLYVVVSVRLYLSSSISLLATLDLPVQRRYLSQDCIR